MAKFGRQFADRLAQCAVKDPLGSTSKTGADMTAVELMISATSNPASAAFFGADCPVRARYALDRVSDRYALVEAP